MPKYTYTPPTNRHFTLSELIAERDPIYDQWGEWTFDPERLVLHDEYGYEIDLETIKDNAELVDWVFHVAGKQMTPEKLGYFIIALRDILRPDEEDWKHSQDGQQHARAYANRVKDSRA